ncbi:hypothetical protein PVK06_002134 [Gossypium arboreum]|uniref:Uncharacterized protein n=1 Tax=Gossypium arboreum TaxID=29729 RepID=A0ABR0R2V5_GOSAR|nr:hypothetical protein PVK06_002134 [Gossypium arboreum]
MTETVNTRDVSEVSVSNSNPTSEFQNIQVAYRLNEKIYLKWSQLVHTFLKRRGKLSHLLRIGPKEGDPKFDVWDEQDSMREILVTEDKDKEFFLLDIPAPIKQPNTHIPAPV